MRLQRVSETDETESNTAQLQTLLAFGRELGRTPPTIWRWRQLGWLDGVVNIAGKPYISREGREKFFSRAKAGEFSKPAHSGNALKARGVTAKGTA